MKLLADFRPFPAGYSLANMFVRAQMDFLSLDGSGMAVQAAAGIKGGLVGLYLMNKIGIRVDFIKPTNTIVLSVATGIEASITVRTFDKSGVVRSHTLVCDHEFITHTITGSDLYALEFDPRAESYLEFISIDVNFCD